MKLINMEQWTVERLAIELQPRLEEYGTLVADVGEVQIIERWRKAARLAGRSLGHPVRTTLSPTDPRCLRFSTDHPSPVSKPKRLSVSPIGFSARVRTFAS
jgi:hypothetical protein